MAWKWTKWCALLLRGLKRNHEAAGRAWKDRKMFWTDGVACERCTARKTIDKGISEVRALQTEKIFFKAVEKWVHRIVEDE